MMGTLYCQQAPSFGWDVKPRSWLSVVIKNPMALLVKEALSLCLLFICSWCVVSALAPLSCGSRRNNPPHPRTVSPWDLSTVLRALKGSPFEPLQSTSLRALSFKTALLLALASVKRVGDLQASSINPVCLEFGPNDSKVVLKPRLGYVSNGAFPLHGTVRFGTARYGTVRLSSGRFAFPPQFSTAIEWAGLFTRRYNCAASTAVTSS